MSINLTSDNRGLVIKTPYSAEFVSELKRLTKPNERAFVGKPENVWIVHPKHAQMIQKLILQVYRSAVALPVLFPTDTPLTGHILRLEYLGQCKQREDKSISAFGTEGNGWNVIIPESVLKRFFEGDDDGEFNIEVEGVRQRPAKPQTLYQALLLKQDASTADVKAAYRRMARLVHPDVNKEPDAAEQFNAVKHAYDLLSDPMKRKRYDAGLALETSLKQKQSDPYDDIFGNLSSMMSNSFGVFYRAPLRCGLLTIDGKQSLGRVHVERIIKWDDVINELGQTMVTSWPNGADKYSISWV